MPQILCYSVAFIAFIISAILYVIDEYKEANKKRTNIAFICSLIMITSILVGSLNWESIQY